LITISKLIEGNPLPIERDIDINGIDIRDQIGHTIEKTWLLHGVILGDQDVTEGRGR